MSPVEKIEKIIADAGTAYGKIESRKKSVLDDRTFAGGEFQSSL